jgi:hypothetical protein
MRDLVPLPAAPTPLDRPEERLMPGLRTRPAAAFLAHLIATAQQAPQTRARRRAAPADAQYAYTAQGIASVRHRGWSI